MSPTLIIITDDKKYNYQQSKTGKVIDIIRMYDDLVSSAMLNSGTLSSAMYGRSITATVPSGLTTFGSDDIPF